MDKELEIKKAEIKIAYHEKMIVAKTQTIAAVEAHKAKIDAAHTLRIQKMNDEIATLEAKKDELEVQKADLVASVDAEEDPEVIG